MSDTAAILDALVNAIADAVADRIAKRSPAASNAKALTRRAAEKAMGIGRTKLQQLIATGELKTVKDFGIGCVVGAVLTSLLFAAGVVAALLLSAEPCRCCGREP